MYIENLSGYRNTPVYVSKQLVTAAFGSSGPFYTENGHGTLVPSLHRVFHTRILKFIQALMTHTEALLPVCHKGNSQL